MESLHQAEIRHLNLAKHRRRHVAVAAKEELHRGGITVTMTETFIGFDPATMMLIGLFGGLLVGIITHPESTFVGGGRLFSHRLSIAGVFEVGEIKYEAIAWPLRN